MFCVLVVAARPKMRMSTDTMSSSTVTIMDFLFLLLKEPTRQQMREPYCCDVNGKVMSKMRLKLESTTSIDAIGRS